MLYQGLSVPLQAMQPVVSAAPSVAPSHLHVMDGSTKWTVRLHSLSSSVHEFNPNGSNTILNSKLAILEPRNFVLQRPSAHSWVQNSVLPVCQLSQSAILPLKVSELIVRHSSPRHSSPQTFITPDIHHLRLSSHQTFITSDIHTFILAQQ